MNSNEAENIKRLKNYEILKNLITCRNLIEKFRFKHKKNDKQLALIAGSLAQIYKDGIRITEALDLVADIVSNKIYKDSLYKVLLSIKHGNSLSESFAQFKDLYPEFFIGIISIGENTGKLYEVLKGLNVYYDKSLSIKKEIKSACAYPILVLVSIIVLGIFLISEVIPSFYEIYKSMNIKMPKTCKIVYDISINLKNNPIVTSVTILSWILIVVIVLKYFSKNIDIGKLTKINIVRSFFEYIMILLFSIISSTGINISYALDYCENSMSFIFLKKKIREINLNIINGKTLTESLEKSDIFSRYTIAIVRIREEGGTIEEGFKELSSNLEYELNEQIQKYLRLINPIFVLIMAIFIILFLLGFVLPLFDNLQSGIRK